jgi:plastocyanin
MIRVPKWIPSACLATGCVIGSLAMGMGIAAGASVKPGSTTPRSTTATTAPAPSATTMPATTSPVTVTPTTTAAPSTSAPALADPFQPQPRSAATAHVSIVDFGYSPATITVTAGTTVTWTNTGGAIHSVTSDSGAFDSSPTCPATCINPGASYSHVFATAGTFAYHCRVHSNMHGTVIVQAAAGTTTTTTSAGSPTTAGGTATPSTVAGQASGPSLAFTGAASNEAWIALGALLTIALGLALRPRRRPFPTDPR